MISAQSLAFALDDLSEKARIFNLKGFIQFVEEKVGPSWC